MSNDAEYLAEQRAASDARQRENAEIKTVAEWDRRMQRVFKGIVPRPSRLSMLRTIQGHIDAGTFGPREHNYKTRATAPRKRRGPGGGGKRGKR